MGFTVALIRTAGTPGLRRAVPLYLGILMVAGVIFGKNGMEPATAVAGMEASVGARLCLWSGWLLLAAPAARAMWSAMGLDYLRWLPVSQARIWLLLGGLLLVLQAPWVLLFAVGGGPIPALAALWLAAGVHAVVVIRPRLGERWFRAAALALAFAVLLAPVPGGPVAALLARVLVGLAMWLIALPLAWRRAVEREREQRSQTLARGLVAALAQCHVTSVYRTHPHALLRGVLVMLLGAGATFLLARANQLRADEIPVYSAVVVVLCATFACSGMSAALAASEDALFWLLCCTGVSERARASARLVAGGALGVVLGLCYGAAVIYAVPMSPLTGARVAAGALAVAVAQMWTAQRIVQWSEHDHGTGREVDGNRVVGALCVAAVVEFVALGVFGDVVIPSFLTLGFALCWRRT